MPDATRVLVLWANPDAPNLGVRALADGAAALLRRAIPGPIDIEYPVFEDEALRPLLSTKALLWGLLGRYGRLTDYLSQFDLVVEAGGGDSFTDIYGLPRLARMVHIHRAVRAAGIPLVFGPQTLGPFDGRVGRAMARRSLRQAKVVLARDSTSAEYAREVLHRPVDATATDVVFALPQPVLGDHLDIVVNVSGLLWEPNPHVDSGVYRAAVRSLVSGLLDAGRGVALVVHVLDNASPDNDVPAVQQLGAEFDGRVGVIVPASLGEVRSVLAAANLVIGSRMHACLNALSCGTAAFPWAYSRKFLPLMRDIGWQSGLDLRVSADPAAETLDFVRSFDVTLTSAALDAVSTVTKRTLDGSVSVLHAHLAGTPA